MPELPKNDQAPILMSSMDNGEHIFRTTPALHDVQTSCNVTDIILGTGASIYASLQRTLESTDQELVLVTCFWARSPSLDTLCAVLRALSTKALHRGGPKIRVRICLSSVSLLQKLFHTQSSDGYTYASTAWVRELYLPPPEELGGIDLEIKSIFIKPFSVMHPKFIIIDRQRVLLPSCNVSWEDWFEGCIGLSGGIVSRFVTFWQDFWRGRGSVHMPVDSDGLAPLFLVDRSQDQGDRLPMLLETQLIAVPCAFLPSQHHINPRFRLPWQRAAPAPNTPLNMFILAAFRTAKRNIYLQTPNLTAPPVLSAIMQALRRGIDIHVVTSERLMILEQLVTAGTTTSRCVQKLRKRYEAAAHGPKGQHGDYATIERGQTNPDIGQLKIEYYQPYVRAPMEPVQSHLKLTAIDDELIVLGSGNMDRASWYTSQELGVALFNTQLTKEILETLGRVLENRKKLVFDSGQ